MLIKKEEQHRVKYEYKNADGEVVDIIYTELAGQRFVELKKQGAEESEVWDVEMFLDVSNILRKTVSQVSNPQVERSQKITPLEQDFETAIVDIRELSASEIQSQVDKSMANYSDTSVPVHSLSNRPVSKHVVVAGEEDESWMEEAANRKGKPAPVSSKKGIKRL